MLRLAEDMGRNTSNFKKEDDVRDNEGISIETKRWISYYEWKLRFIIIIMIIIRLSTSEWNKNSKR